jgi:hypothetical protein
VAAPRQAKIRELTGGDDVDIVFEHPGRETFGASVYVARRGGTIVTCASTSGFMHEYDNRYLWMNLKRIVGSHFANYREAWEANRLIQRGLIHPTLSRDVLPRPRPARPPTTCTATCTRARSACCAWPRRRPRHPRLLACAVLAGLLLNTALGWWWADPLAGLVLVGYALTEGRGALRPLIGG